MPANCHRREERTVSKALMTCPPRSGPVSLSTPPEVEFASFSAGGAPAGSG